MEVKGYGVVFFDEDGGNMVNVFLKKDIALLEIDKMKRTFENVGHTGAKVYLSELRYDKENKKILDNELINETSELKVNC